MFRRNMRSYFVPEVCRRTDTRPPYYAFIASSIYTGTVYLSVCLSVCLVLLPNIYKVTTRSQEQGRDVVPT